MDLKQLAEVALRDSAQRELLAPRCATRDTLRPTRLAWGEGGLGVAPGQDGQVLEV